MKWLCLASILTIAMACGQSTKDGPITSGANILLPRNVIIHITTTVVIGFTGFGATLALLLEGALIQRFRAPTLDQIWTMKAIEAACSRNKWAA